MYLILSRSDSSWSRFKYRLEPSTMIHFAFILALVNIWLIADEMQIKRTLSRACATERFIQRLKNRTLHSIFFRKVDTMFQL